jgi:hypothetical protein
MAKRYNERCKERARNALAAYADINDNADDETNARDLTADLFHLLGRKRKAVIRMAEHHYQCEKE